MSIPEKQSGRQVAAANLQKFTNWVAERTAAEDWQDYIRFGKLNRSEIARECEFALSVLRQNPAVKSALEALEADYLGLGVTQRKGKAPDNPKSGLSDVADERLRTEEVPGTEPVDQTDQAATTRILKAKAKAEARVKDLQEKYATLKAENNELREQLQRFKHLDDHLCKTGRILHP